MMEAMMAEILGVVGAGRLVGDQLLRVRVVWVVGVAEEQLVWEVVGIDSEQLVWAVGIILVRAHSHKHEGFRSGFSEAPCRAARAYCNTM